MWRSTGPALLRAAQAPGAAADPAPEWTIPFLCIFLNVRRVYGAVCGSGTSSGANPGTGPRMGCPEPGVDHLDLQRRGRTGISDGCGKSGHIFPAFLGIPGPFILCIFPQNPANFC